MERPSPTTSKKNGESPEPKRLRLGTPHPATKIVFSQPPHINYLAYEVLPRMAKTLQALLIAENIASRTQVVVDRGVSGILMSFKNWEQATHFFQWGYRGEKTRQLMKVLRVTCGPIGLKSQPHFDANDILHMRANDATVSEMVHDDEPQSNEAVRCNFLDYLTRGIECQVCECDHVPPKPTLFNC